MKAAKPMFSFIGYVISINFVNGFDYMLENLIYFFLSHFF